MSSTKSIVECPTCGNRVYLDIINSHLDSDCKVGLVTSVLHSSPLNFQKASTIVTPTKRKDISEFFSPSQRPKTEGIPESISPSSGSSGVKTNASPSSDVKLISNISPSNELKHKTNIFPKPQVHTQTQTQTQKIVSSTASDTLSLKLSRDKDKNIPLSEKIRPRTLQEFFGQTKFNNEESTLFKIILEKRTIPSLILWGPPGCGKTTLANILKFELAENYQFYSLSAVTHKVEDIKKTWDKARNERNFTGKGTILFLDEIHRFSKSQQDTLLPGVEKGDFILIGATTENPSFRLNSALLSRCQTLIFEKLNIEDLIQILERAKNLLNLNLTDDGIKLIANLSDGDARQALNYLDLISNSISAKEKESEDNIDPKKLKDILTKNPILYDQAGEEHYNLISAFHKSVRGNSADGAIYWLGRMLYSGEDPLYIARRMIRMASEDIGLADSHALPLALAAYQSTHLIGRPECELILAHCATYLARAPKSVEVYKAFNQVQNLIRNDNAHPVPLHLRNAPTQLMKNAGYGDGYIYNPDYHPDDPLVKAQTYLPEALKHVTFFEHKDKESEDDFEGKGKKEEDRN